MAVSRAAIVPFSYYNPRMFCPLCHAEYREGFTGCSTCQAALVAGDALESERKPPRMKFVTHSRREADQVFSRLYEVGIACLEKAQTDFFSVHITRRRPTVTLYVLERDAAAARQAAGVEFVPDRPTVEMAEGTPVQDCPFCAAKFPAGQTLCPACRGDLLDWNPNDPQAPSLADAPPSDAEPADAVPDGGEAQLVWRGGDPVVFSRAVEVLREHHIVYYTNQTSQHLAFGEAMPRPKLEVLVGAKDASRARELVAEFQDPFPLVPQETLPEEDQEAPSAESDAQAAGSKDRGPETSVAARLSSLRWAFLFLAACLLVSLWVGAVGVRSRDPETTAGQVRAWAIFVLLLSAAGSGVASLWELFRAWSWRADKTGLLTWFFGFLVVSWLVLFTLPILIAGAEMVLELL